MHRNKVLIDLFEWYVSSSTNAKEKLKVQDSLKGFYLSKASMHESVCFKL